MGKTTRSDMYCTKCGKKNIPIQRKKGQEREKGHLKKMYCIYCQQEVNMVEIKECASYTLDDFKLEFKYQNFDNEGNRKMPLKDFKKYLNDIGVLI